MSTSTVNTYNNVAGDQHNHNHFTYNISSGPPSPEFLQLLSFNDAPLDLLSVNFTGRDDDRCAIVGMHGIGKSQVAAKLAKDAYTQGRYHNIVWMQGTTIEKLNQGFSKLLHLVGHPDRSDPDQSARLTAARRWLEGAESGKWLLVVDNLARETVEFVQEHLPRTNGQGNVLFTTRTQGVAEALTRVAGEQHGTIELRIPNVADAAKLLVDQLKGLEIDVDSVKAQEVVKCVGCLPLAVAQAAAYLKETGRALDDVLALFQSEHKIDLMQWENDLSSYQEKSIAATFVSQLNDLERTFPDASLLLHVIAFFDPERIPLDMLTTGARVIAMSQSQHPSDAVPSTKPDLLHRIKNHVFHRHELDANIHIAATSIRSKTPSLLHKIKSRVLYRKELDDTRLASGTRSIRPASPNPKLASLLALIQSTTAFHNAIMQLQNRSLAKRQGSGPSSSLWIHDLVRFIVLQHTKSLGSEREYVDCAVELISRVCAQIDNPTLPEYWPMCETVIPHIQSLSGREDIMASGSMISNNTLIVKYLQSRWRFVEAQALCKETLMNAQRIWGSEHVDTLLLMHEEAYISLMQGRIEEAELLVTRVVRGQEKHLGPEHSKTLQSIILQANIAGLQGRYHEAEILLDRVLLRQKTQLGSEHLDTVQTMYHLATIYQEQGRYHEAETFIHQVLLVREKHFGSEHIRTLATMYQLADLHRVQGRYTEAESLLKRVLEGEEKQLGAQHASILFTVSTLASVYVSQGRYPEAERLFDRVQVNLERHLGSEHVATLANISDLAFLYHNQGRYHEAEMLFCQVLPDLEKQLGPEHIQVLAVVSGLACVYREQGRYGEAEKLFDRVLASGEEQLGLENIETLSAMCELGCLYRSQARYLEAEKLLERVLKSQEKRLGPEHDSTLYTICELARVYHRLGQQSKAVTLFDRALSGQEKQLGSRHVDTLKTMHYLASLYHDQGQDEEAEKLLVDVLTHREEVLGISHPHTVETITLLADVDTAQGRLDDAQAIQRRAESRS